MNKQNRILAAILALQIVIAVIGLWPSSSAAGAKPLFGDLEPEQIVRLSIQDVEGNRIVLARGEAGWQLPEAGGYPAQDELVNALLVKIAAIRVDRQVTETPDSHQRLGVADENFERLIQFELADGTQHKLYLGTSPSYQVLHVRADDKDTVYLALGMQTYDAQAEVTAWIDPVYLSAPTDQVFALTLENANGRFEFVKDESGEWTMEGLNPDESLNPNNVSALLNRLAAVRMLRPLGKESQPTYGLGEPRAKVTIDLQNEAGNQETRVLRVGAQWAGEANGVVVKSATSPYYVLVADYTVEDLVEKNRQDFLQAPPTPEPAETP